MAHLLVVDDAFHEVRDGLDAVLREHRVLGATSGAAALKLLEQEPSLDAVLLDVRMPATVGEIDEEEGLAVFERIQELRPELPVIFLSAYDDLRIINRALTAGAFWYLKKPPDLLETRSLVERAVQAGRQRRESAELRRAKDARALAVGGGRRGGASRRLIGLSPLMHRLRADLGMFAATDVPVLILGETGTGKELCAREIHARSGRRGGPFVAVNCHELNQSEVSLARLFGHARGAFTGAAEEASGVFEMASHGTLFLDEIGDLDQEMQGRLLRVLQEREVVRLGAGERPRPVDVRMVFATNRDPQALVREGKLREDFYYRIAIGVLQVPPLRDRLDDLPELVPALLARAEAQDQLPRCSVAPEAVERLRDHRWPGNVRELENLLKRAAVRQAGTGRIQEEDFHLPVPDLADPDPVAGPSDLFQEIVEDGGYPDGIRSFRDAYGEIALREVLRKAVRLTGSVVRAGELLGFVRADSRDKDFENLRAWMKNLKLRKADIMAEGGA
ncbi:MAG: sigma-54-dependent Fis family transcriptional regulator [Planctomycetes bacterium]|nr:sigma-54-dependent Fis family transcriptional regulator [Planctomycetota bacterium]